MNCANSWYFADGAGSYLAPEVSLTDRVIGTGNCSLPGVCKQPITQLSLDIIVSADSFVVFRSPTDPQKLLRAQMQETYSQSLSGHTGMGTWELGLGTDGWYRHGAAQEVLVNCRK